MPVPNSINDLSVTPSANYPTGGESPATADDYLRAHAAFIASLRDLNKSQDPHSQYAMKQHVVMNTGAEVKNVDLNNFGNTGIYRYDNSSRTISNAPPDGPVYAVLEVINNGVNILQRMTAAVGTWERSWRPAADAPPAWRWMPSTDWVMQEIAKRIPNLANYVTTNTDQNILGFKEFIQGNHGIADATGGRAKFSIRGTDTGAAFMQFHRPNQYAVYFGLGQDNVLRVGGVSLGAASYPLLYPNTPQAPGQAPVYGARAWGFFGVATNNGNYFLSGHQNTANVSSISVSKDTHIVHFATAMPDNNYLAVVTDAKGRALFAFNKTNSSFTFSGDVGGFNFVVYR